MTIQEALAELTARYGADQSYNISADVWHFDTQQVEGQSPVYDVIFRAHSSRHRLTGTGQTLEQAVAALHTAIALRDKRGNVGDAEACAAEAHDIAETPCAPSQETGD